MKNCVFFAVLFCSSFLSGCAKSSDSKGASAKATNVSTTPALQAVGPNGYKFDGTNSKDEPCTTGVKNFETMNELCMNIQDDVQNARCAWRERFEKFYSDCRPLGFEFLESVNCRVTLLKPDAEFGAFASFDKKDVIQSNNYCVGRNRFGGFLSGINLYGYFHEQIAAEIDMVFSPKAKQATGGRTYFSLKMYRPSVKGGQTVQKVINDFHFDGNGSVLTAGPTLDKRYKYHLSCWHVWACGTTDEEQ